jgi:hypothetical protein
MTHANRTRMVACATSIPPVRTRRCPCAAAGWNIPPDERVGRDRDRPAEIARNSLHANQSLGLATTPDEPEPGNDP